MFARREAKNRTPLVQDAKLMFIIEVDAAYAIFGFSSLLCSELLLPRWSQYMPVFYCGMMGPQTMISIVFCGTYFQKGSRYGPSKP